MVTVGIIILALITLAIGFMMNQDLNREEVNHKMDDPENTNTDGDGDDKDSDSNDAGNGAEGSAPAA